MLQPELNKHDDLATEAQDLDNFLTEGPSETRHLFGFLGPLGVIVVHRSVLLHSAML